MSIFLRVAAAILFLMDSFQKLIRSSEILREQPIMNAIQPTVIVLTSFLENGRFWLGAKKYMGRIAQAHKLCL